MHRSKITVFVILLSLIICITTLNYVYAKNNEAINDSGITIMNDTKDINDTHEIKFQIENNNDIVSNKIAAGMKSTAEIEINLEKVEGFVDIDLKIDDSKLNEIFKLNTSIDDKNIFNEKISKIKGGSIKKILLELIWDENNILDTDIGNNTDFIEIPIQIKVLPSA